MPGPNTYLPRMTDTLAADPAGLSRAAALLRAGELVAFGTETVYGLGADATNPTAVARVFAAKGRPRFNPLICHYPDAASAFTHVAATQLAQRLAAAFWPGPLTLVLPRRPDCPVALLAGAGLDTLGVRVPAPETARALIAAAARPIAAPSANRSGQVSPTEASHVLNGLRGQIAAVLDNGPCVVGIESTVLDLTMSPPMLLRPGGVTTEAIETVIGPIGRALLHATLDGSPKLRSPGLAGSHYAPVLPLRIDAVAAGADEALLAFGRPLVGAGAFFNLSERGDLTEAAARLFAGLRRLDSEGRAAGLRGIAAMKVPESGLGLAINDRLRRAAAPR
jgi:L-threonylcarbamoyladenylate synthase